MTMDRNDFVHDEEIVFIGKVTASISHELKNIMAAISETSGLLGDLVEIAKGKTSTDLKDIAACSQSISEDIGRGFEVIRHLNEFAHSTDEPFGEADLDKTLVLVANLARCLSFASEIDVQQVPGGEKKVHTRPLLLEDLLYRAFVLAFKAVGPQGRFSVCAHSRDAGARILFSELAGMDKGQTLYRDLERIAANLNAELVLSKSGSELEILLTRDVRSDNLKTVN